MRKIDISCSSQAATAICLSSMEPSSSSSILAGGSSPAIDRYNPIIRDSRRCGGASIPVPPPPPPTPKPKPRGPRRHKKKNPKEIMNEEEDDREMKKKSSDVQIARKKSWSCTNPTAFVTPPGSTRYLLSGNELIQALSDFDAPPLNLFPPSHINSNSKDVDTDHQSRQEKPPSSDQVVVLRVSLHCRGCERKMRKHISRMEGVRSFNIDFAAKKVTVSGKVTPLEVLSSISKVKNAQLWAPIIASEFKGAAAAAASWVTADNKGTSTFVGA